MTTYDILWERLNRLSLPIDSLLISKESELVFEAYNNPYDVDTLHRMFSITKSVVSVAIGKLFAEHLVHPQDKICSYFPDYYTNEFHNPYMDNLTILDMLKMQGIYSATTYQKSSGESWTRTFFEAKPSHSCGRIFHYDTSATHTLCELVYRITGMDILSYLRPMLDTIGFSKEAYIIKNVFGEEMGGSGLMAKPSDILKLGDYILQTRNPDGDAIARYLYDATSLQAPTVHSAMIPEEGLGYGYQFWLIREGYMMYGLGSQYLLSYPGLHMNIMINADTQSLKGSGQSILDTVYDVLFPNQGVAVKDCIPQIPYNNLAKDISYQWEVINSDKKDDSGQPIFNKIGLNLYKAVKTMSEVSGQLSLYTKNGDFNIPFSFVAETRHIIEIYEQSIYSKARFLDENILYIESRIADECVGILTFLLHFSSKGLTMKLKKSEETYFDEFDGFLEAKIK